MDIRITGGPEAARAIVRRQRDIHPTAKKVFMNAGRRIQRRLALYPAQAEGTLYRRTGTLGRRWQLRSNFSPGSLYVNVYNMTEYGPYVQGEETQAWMHVDRWETEAKALEAETEGFVKELSGALVRVLT